MSFLFPLFLTGGLVVGLPIILHMIRQRTRERVPFSSLMFLQPTPPRFKHRRRLENRLLLLLRCLIVLLLALAFARPFVARVLPRQVMPVGRRLVLLVDTSASMRRAGLWEQVSPAARSALEDTSELDRVCVMHFDRRPRTLLSFEEWEGLTPDQRLPVTLARLAELRPGWDGTDLGQALVGAAETLEDDEVNQALSARAKHQVVLISDLQQGSQVQALYAYDWPAGTALLVKRLTCAGPTNASLQWVQDRPEATGESAAQDALCVRVTNAPDSSAGQFQVAWSDAGTAPTPVYVAPGHSTVIRVPYGPRSASARQLTLSGDDHDFDNALYVAAAKRQEVKLLYLGDDDPNDPEAMLYYVKRAFAHHGPYDFRVVAHRGRDRLTQAQLQDAQLVMVSQPLNPTTLNAVQSRLQAGQTVLLTLSTTEQRATLRQLTGLVSLDLQEALVDDYAMLEQLDVTHPLLRPFAAPAFGDFTQVHVWHYRRVDLAQAASAQVLARLDTGDPLWFSQAVGQGQLVTLCCGWHPQDSDLALSSKFVPLIYSILESAGLRLDQAVQYGVGDVVALGSDRASRPVTVRKPDQRVVSISSTQRDFAETDQPGVYQVSATQGDHAFAVNLAPRESNTAAMSLDLLEQAGVTVVPAFGQALTTTEQARPAQGWAAQERQQKIWRWVLLAVWMVLLMEIALSARLTQGTAALQGETP